MKEALLSGAQRLDEARLPFEESLEAEVVVVGTGAGGATAAKVLAERGIDVLMLEEGPRLSTKDRPREVAGALAQAMRESGTQANTNAVPMVVLQASCVGGSTAVNSGIIWRLPEDVARHWSERHGLSQLVNPAELARIYDRLETDLEVTKTQDRVLGGNAALLAKGAEALGMVGKSITRNAARCDGAGECLQGCPQEKRQSMDVSYVPNAIANGARLLPLRRVSRVRFEKGRAVGVEGVILDPSTRKPRARFAVRASQVIISAGVVHTPLILRRSGVTGLTGERFQAHPGTAVLGKFPEPVRMAFGATQGYEVPQRARGFKVESLSLPPEMLAARIPGVGRQWQERLGHLDHYAQWCTQIRMKAHGRIREGLLGPRIDFTPTREDMATTQEALLEICRMMFLAGAEEVYPGVNGVPEILRSLNEVEKLADMRWKASDVHLVASHLFGTAVAGSDPRRSVVDEGLESHEKRGLFVMDASVFPTNLGVNPQHSIMAVVMRASELLADRLQARRAA